jgi:hypothetical protein
MSNKPAEYWTIRYKTGDSKYYLRKGYQTVFMQDIKFTEMKSYKNMNRIFEHIVNIVATSGYPIFLDDKTRIQETDPTKFELYKLTLS